MVHDIHSWWLAVLRARHISDFPNINTQPPREKFTCDCRICGERIKATLRNINSQEVDSMCGCLLLPFKLVFVVLKLAAFLVLFMLSLALLPFLLLALFLFMIKCVFS
jgi:hypothetical protein